MTNPGDQDALNLLVVEDEPDMRLLIRAHLRRDPRVRVTGEAASADQALGLVRLSPPDLIILDHSIEGETMGLDAAPQLKELAPDSKILLFSAFSMGKQARAQPVVNAFLSKSEMPKLLRTVQGLLGLEPAEPAGPAGFGVQGQ